MTYQMIKDENGNIRTDVIKIIDENNVIKFAPKCSLNQDWLEYIKWTEIPGNLPEEAE